MIASVNFLDGTKIEQQRILLAVYPLLYVQFSSSPAAFLTVRRALQALLLRFSLDDHHSVGAVILYAVCCAQSVAAMLSLFALIVEAQYVIYTRSWVLHSSHCPIL